MIESQTDATALLVRTLLGAGFAIESVNRQVGGLLFQAKRLDEFGAAVDYLIVLAADPVETQTVEAWTALAESTSARLVVVTESNPSAPHFQLREFCDRLGGAVTAWLPLEDTYTATLSALGHNGAVDGLPGRPDRLFEIYAHAGLSFIFHGRVLRYGQERLFEGIPDGAGVGPPGQPFFLYDAKAATDGYSLTADTIRQFESYVTAFRRRYGHQIGNPHAFLVVSGHFQQQVAGLEERSRDLYAVAGVPLVCIDAETLGSACQLVAGNLSLRTSLDWNRLLAGPTLRLDEIREQLAARQRDRILPGATTWAPR